MNINTPQQKDRSVCGEIGNILGSLMMVVSTSVLVIASLNFLFFLGN